MPAPDNKDLPQVLLFKNIKHWTLHLNMKTQWWTDTCSNADHLLQHVNRMMQTWEHVKQEKNMAHIFDLTALEKTWPYLSPTHTWDVQGDTWALIPCNTMQVQLKHCKQYDNLHVLCGFSRELFAVVHAPCIMGSLHTWCTANGAKGHFFAHPDKYKVHNSSMRQ